MGLPFPFLHEDENRIRQALWQLYKALVYERHFPPLYSTDFNSQVSSKAIEKLTEG